MKTATYTLSDLLKATYELARPHFGEDSVVSAQASIMQFSDKDVSTSYSLNIHTNRGNKVLTSFDWGKKYQATPAEALEAMQHVLEAYLNKDKQEAEDIALENPAPDDYYEHQVDEWHASQSELSLQEYLEMNNEEYERFMKLNDPLPENWCVQRTEDNFEVINNFYKALNKTTLYRNINGYVCKNGMVIKHPSVGYPAITYEQWLQVPEVKNWLWTKA